MTTANVMTVEKPITNLVRRFNLAKEFIKLMVCRPIGVIFLLSLHKFGLSYG